ncbi:MAG: ribonuclease PH [Oligosphaeraceae bacterium]|nr:ribonuclease PH [Oligosphaeraceae bacterium]
MQRKDNRLSAQLRPLSLQFGFQHHPVGSVLMGFGHTRVLCSVSVEQSVPRWMKEQNQPGGWITAEYQMLPGATAQRTEREVTRGKLSGRSAEIQRLIGRSLRAVVDLSLLPGLTLHVDCDVIDADGGTRCAAITGAALALECAVRKLLRQGILTESPLKDRVAAVSVGMLSGQVLLDLCYEEDSAADVDMNVVMTAGGRFVELQGSGEEASFSEAELGQLLSTARCGMQEIFAFTAKALRDAE